MATISGGGDTDTNAVFSKSGYSRQIAETDTRYASNILEVMMPTEGKDVEEVMMYTEENDVENAEDVDAKMTLSS